MILRDSVLYIDRKPVRGLDYTSAFHFCKVYMTTVIVRVSVVGDVHWIDCSRLAVPHYSLIRLS